MSEKQVGKFDALDGEPSPSLPQLPRLRWSKSTAVPNHHSLKEPSEIS